MSDNLVKLIKEGVPIEDLKVHIWDNRNVDGYINMRHQYNASTYSPLSAALSYRDAEVVKLLIEAGADVNLDNPLVVVSYMLSPWSESDDVDLQDAMEKLNLLISAGANVNAADEKSKTILMHFAGASRAKKQFIEAIIAAGADVHATTMVGRTALIEAAIEGNLQAVRVLLDSGCTIMDSPALYWSILQEREAVALELISRGAPLDITNGHATLLHLLARVNEGMVSVARTLLARGVDATIQDCNGETALDIARTKQHTELIKLLEKHIKAVGKMKIL